MGKSFNDDELEDIMNEIESLESSSDIAQGEPIGESQEMNSQPEAEEIEYSEPEAAHHEPVHLEEASELEEVKSFPTHKHNPVHSGGSKTSLNFSVEGNTTLDLSFQAGQKKVHCIVTNDTFEVELEGGLKFTLPLHDLAHKKSA